MNDPLAETELRQERLSLPALTSVVVLHIGLLWIALQATPALQVTRQVVYQMLTPITRMVDPVPVPVSLSAIPRSVRSVSGSISHSPPQTSPVTVTPVKPVERLVEKAPDPVVETPEPQLRHVPVVKEAVPIAIPELPAVQLPPTMQEPAPIPLQ